MNTINDGGPAFPYVFQHEDDSRFTVSGFAPGMTLRDCFMMHCPLTLQQSAKVYGMPLDDILRESAHADAFMMFDAADRVKWADAMLKARHPAPADGAQGSAEGEGK